MAHTLSGLLLQGSRAVPVNPWNIGCHAHFALVHTGIEQRRVSCRGVLILGCQKPTAQQASNRIGWCSRLLKMTPEERLNADLKQSMGKQVPVRTISKLRQAANDFMTTLREAPERVMAYFQDRHVL